MSSSPIAIVAGYCDITPEIPLPLFGDRHRQGLSRGVDSHLECNVLILVQGDLRVAILQLDTLFTSRQFQDALSSRMNVPCNLLVVASHTHFAPALVGDKPLLGGFSEAYFQFVVDRVSDLVNRLLSETPASASILRLEQDCPAGVCRRKRLFSVNKSPPYVGFTTAFLPNLEEKIDQSLTTVGLFDSSDRLYAVIWNWACHPTVSPLTDHVSSEYVGFVRDRVRTHYQRDVPVVFLPGAMGDIRPKIITSKPSLSWRIRYPLNKLFFAVPTTPQQYSTFCHEVADSIPFDQLSAEAADPFVGRMQLDRFSCPLNQVLIGRQSAEKSIPIAILSLNADLRIAFLGCEPSNRYVEKIKSRMGNNTLIAGYFENVFGYLPTDEQLPEGGYEVDGFQKWFGIEGTFRPGFERDFLDSFTHPMKLTER